MRAEVESALPSSGPVLIVGKSLGTLAAPVAAERELAAPSLFDLLADESELEAAS